MCILDHNIIMTNSTPLDDMRQLGVGNFCFNLMKKYGEKVVQIDISTGEKETYDALFKKCIRTSIVLRKMGVQKDDMVTICSRTNLNACVPLIACFLIGALPSYLDIRFSLFEINHFLSGINPKYFLIVEDFLDIIQCFTRDKAKQSEIIVFNDDFFKPQEEETEFTPILIDDLGKTAVIHFSSGTTGLPKAVCVNHYNLLYNSSKLELDKVVLSYDSLHWGLEVSHLLNNISVGGCRLICSGTDDWKDTWSFVDKYKINVMCLPPRDIIYLIDCGKPHDADLSSLSTIYVEGSALPQIYLQNIRRLLPNVDLLTHYGQTELGLITIFGKNDKHRDLHKNKPTSMGVPVSGTGLSLKVVSLESGEPLGPKEHGQLLVKSRCSMNGYCNLDSSDQFDKDGWIKTGDIVYYDEEFCFFFVGRIKEVILYQGWHVVPALLEAELLSHPVVKFAAVIGVPHEKDTEHPLGLVALHHGSSTVTATEIEKYMENRVPSKYLLRGGVKVIGQSYFDSGNKIRRYKLRELVLSGEI